MDIIGNAYSTPTELLNKKLIRECNINNEDVEFNEDEIQYCKEYIVKFCKVRGYVNMRISSRTSATKVSKYILETKGVNMPVKESSFTKAMFDIYGEEIFGLYDREFYFRIIDRNAVKYERELLGIKPKNYYKEKTLRQKR